MWDGMNAPIERTFARDSHQIKLGQGLSHSSPLVVEVKSGHSHLHT